MKVESAHFLHDFSIKNFPYLVLSLWTKFQCHTFFPSRDIKQNVLSKAIQRSTRIFKNVFVIDIH